MLISERFLSKLIIFVLYQRPGFDLEISLNSDVLFIFD